MRHDQTMIALVVGRLQAEMKALKREFAELRVLFQRAAILVLLWGLAIIATLGNDKASELAAGVLSALLK